VINFKKIFFAIITSFLYLIVFLTLVLLFYTIFYYNPISTKKKTDENLVIEENIEPEKIEEESSSIQVEEQPKTENESQEIEDDPVIETKITDSLFATVGNKAITNSDIYNEMKIKLIMTGQSFSENMREQLETAAIQSAIRRAIKKIEIEKYSNLQFDQSELNKELNQLSSDMGMDLETFKNTFIANGIDFSVVGDIIKTELMWNNLIFELYKDKLKINVKEIEEKLKIIQNKKEIDEYLVSEIIVKSVKKSELNSKITEIKNKIKVDGFEQVAMNISIAESALKGGNLGWISENVISDEFKSKITATSIGSVSEPVFLPEGILFFKVRDKRKIKAFVNLEQAKNELVKAEKTKILNMRSLSHYDILKRSISVNYY